MNLLILQILFFIALKLTTKNCDFVFTKESKDYHLKRILIGTQPSLE